MALLALMLSLFLLSGPALADTPAELIRKGEAVMRPGDDVALRRAQSYFEKALLADPKSYAAAWHLSEAVIYRWENTFDWAEQGRKEEAQLRLALYGLQAATLAHKLNPEGVEGFFYSASALGAWAVTNGVIDSLNKLPEITRYATGCVKADPEAKFERGGCYRLASAILIRTPGNWFALPKAEAYIKRAIAADPAYAMTYNYASELYLKRGEPARALESIDATIALLTAQKSENARSAYENARDLKKARLLREQAVQAMEKEKVP